MFFMKSASSERIFHLLYFSIRRERQKLPNLSLIKIIPDHIDIQHRRKVLQLKNSFRQHDCLSPINQVKLALVDDSFFEALNRVQIVSQRFRDVLDFLFEGFLDLDVVLAPEIYVLGLFEKV